jgi:hypothetical protein
MIIQSYKCKDVVKSFNKKAEFYKQLAIQNGLEITGEWEINGYQCFHAIYRAKGVSSYAEVGACVNGCGRVWYTIPAGSKVFEITFHQK